MQRQRKIAFAAAAAALLAVGAFVMARTWSEAPRTDEEKRQEIRVWIAAYRNDFPGVSEMTDEEVVAGQQEGDVVLVDARTPAEQAVSKIPGAVRAAEFERNRNLYGARRIVVYCTIGYRSARYVKRLNEQGLRAWNLEGGILAWVHGGHSVVSDGRPTRRVHVYGRRWDLLPKGYESVR